MDVFEKFKDWYSKAVSHDSLRANMVALATVDNNQIPHCRIVLFKELKENKLLFYTNYESPKAHELEENPNCAMTFHWAWSEQQIRVEGKVTRTDRNTSEDYWNSRPRGSQISGTISPQGKAIESFQWLVEKRNEFVDQNGNGPIPCPEFWGGYQIEPTMIEFWQGKPDRLHLRERFTKQSEKWGLQIIAP